MEKKFRICGIDASISSTGVCFADCVFDISQRELLLEFLLTKNPNHSISEFQKCFSVVSAMELYPEPEHEKGLKKSRKNQKDSINDGNSPSLKDNRDEEVFFSERMRSIVTRLWSLISLFDPKVILTEDYSYHSQGSITQLAELKGSFRLQMCLKQTFENAVYLNAPITSVKKIAAFVGNANKEKICEEMKRFGFVGYEDLDDQLDATAIALSAFYSIHHRLYPFEFPTPKKAKEKKEIESWKKCLDTFANRIGRKDELERWIKE